MPSIIFKRKVWPQIDFWEVSVIDKRNNARVVFLGVPDCSALKRHVLAFLDEYDENYKIQIVFKIYWQDTEVEADACEQQIKQMVGLEVSE